ncbi:hypothetical protein WJX73_004895 [Symbiochloris irregularis]|uniref:PUM-HD domain-containing protein n=1 Tax=Symbiochloris irregularis TaxID=706552 RepID=A0AAW1NK43_9CHLO
MLNLCFDGSSKKATFSQACRSCAEASTKSACTRPAQDMCKGYLMTRLQSRWHGHVVQCCLACIHPTSCIRFVIQEMMGTEPPAYAPSVQPGIVPLSRNPYGCHAVNALLQHCDMPDMHGQAMDEIAGSARTLANDVNGSLCLQWLMEFGSQAHRVQITSLLQDRVVEILGEQRPGKFAAHLARIASDRGGSFVVERVLAICHQGQRERLVEHLQDLIDKNGPTNYAKQLCQQVGTMMNAILAQENAAAAEAKTGEMKGTMAQGIGDWLEGAMESAGNEVPSSPDVTAGVNNRSSQKPAAGTTALRRPVWKGPVVQGRQAP